MKNNKINFNFSFLNSESNSQEILPKNDWNAILNSISSTPIRVLLENFAEPITIQKNKIVIALKNQKFVDMIYNTNKIQYIREACNKFYNQDHSEVTIICKSCLNDNKNENILHMKVSQEEKNDIDENLHFTKIKYNDKTNVNWKPIILILAIILITGFITLGINEDKKRNAEIAQIKSSAYEYLKNSDNANFNKELQKLSKYGLDNTDVKKELKEKYKEEIDRIVSDIAYNYENNKAQFEVLKQKYLPILFKNNEELFNQSVERKLGYKELSLKPIPLPVSGVMHNYTGNEAIAPFEIKTPSTDQNFYIKLIDAITGKTEVIIFMRGGETKKMNVPLGTYKLKRAAGYTWYGEENLFGHNTVYTASDQWLTFQISGSYVEGHTLTLYKVTNGNFSTKDIKAEDF